MEERGKIQPMHGTERIPKCLGMEYEWERELKRGRQARAITWEACKPHSGVSLCPKGNGQVLGGGNSYGGNYGDKDAHVAVGGAT